MALAGRLSAYVFRIYCQLATGQWTVSNDTLCHAVSMTTHYIPLTNLPDGDDLSQATSTNPRQVKSWRLPKRWLSALLFICGLFTILLLSGSWSSSSGKRQQTPSSQDESSTLFLLGQHEDPTKLWFPPISSGANFQPSVASYNEPPPIERRLRTPLFVAFTRNNAMLHQTVLSYIASGWPREDIIVVDNSGTMDANNLGLLSHDNPFFLDYEILRRRYGVSILQTPTLLNFSQLMNFYLRVSIAHRWRYFFWSHMDVAVLSDEEARPYKSFYERVLGILSELGISSLNAVDGAANSDGSTWAIKYFSYDWLTLVNVAAWRKIGQWDTFIPYYGSDCDAYSRVVLNGFTKDDVRAGRIFDLPSAITDPEAKFFPPSVDKSSSGETSTDSGLNSKRYQTLFAELQKLESEKPEHHRNQWQSSDKGGRGEPWTYDPQGFQQMWWDTADIGRELYKKKWGTSECRLDEHGVTLSDEWRGEP